MRWPSNDYDRYPDQWRGMGFEQERLTFAELALARLAAPVVKILVYINQIRAILIL